MTTKFLHGKKVLITAGPTREYWDPVRYLTNGSSGRMGIALANEAVRLGAKVILVLGPVPRSSFLVSRFDAERGTRNEERETGVHVVDVISAWDMYNAVKKHLPRTDFFVGSAAVVDYRPAAPQKRKIKHHQPSLTLKLYGNPDIIAMVGHLEKGRPACVVGFALETDHLMANARQKLLRKQMDWIVANRETNMGPSTGEGTLISRWGDRIPLKKMPKEKLAQKIWQTILSNR